MPDPSPTQPAATGADPLLERCILAHEDGQLLEVERILAHHPDRAQELRARLLELQQLGILTPPRRPPMPERLGEFRLLRPLGKGGMGLVYLAVQESLQREVALKLVRPEQLLFADARDRFRREVLAVARLHHPGIVPVHTFGEVDGVPFYAMAHLPGVTLGEVLQQLQGTPLEQLDERALGRGFRAAMQQKGETGEPASPLFAVAWARACCQLVRDMALALQHAHEQGVLHRDLKPNNAILTADGAVHLIDFGLASAQGEQRITRSGATLGSLPYMAPEQVRGDVQAIDARTDVYALGVTLYELLTLKLPHGDGSGTTRERILLGNVVAPTRHNGRIHADAEAICLQAMEVEPGRRYQTAAELARDLDRFLDLEPVRARRQTATLRARRWLRRHPARAVAIALGFVLLVPAPLLFGVQQSLAAGRIRDALGKVQQQKQIADDNLREAERQQARALANLDRALAAVDLMLSRTAQARLAEIPRTARLRKQLLEDALQFHEALAAAETGARTQEERARSRRRVGQIRLELGELKPAIAVLEQARDELQLLLQQQLPQGEPLRLHLELADACRSLTEAYSRLDRREEQAAAAAQAVEHWRCALAARPGNRQYEASLAAARLDALRPLADQRRFDEVFAELDRLEQELHPDKVPELQGEELATRWCSFARIADVRGIMLSQTGETSAAERQFELAQQRLQQAIQASTDGRTGRVELAELSQRLALVAHQRRDWPKAAPHIAAAVQRLQELADAEPEVPDWQARLATMLSTRADNMLRFDDQDGARADHDRAVAMLERLTARFPDELDYHRRLAIVCGERGMARARQGLAAAAGDFERSVAEFERILQAHPEDDQAAANLVATLANLARLQGDTDLTLARQTVARAVELNQGRRFGEAARSRIEVLMESSELAMRDFDHEAGLRFMQQASAAADAWLQERPADPLRQGTKAMVAANHGTLLLQLQDYPAARDLYAATVELARSAAKGGNPVHRRVLAILLLRLCDVNLRLQDVDAARRWFQQALDETGVSKAQVASMPPLDGLFDRAELQPVLRAREASADKGDKK